MRGKLSRRMRIQVGLAFLGLFLLCALANTARATEPETGLKPVSIFVEGDSSAIPKFINICRQMGSEYGLDFHFVDKQADKYDYRVVLSAEGSSAWDLLMEISL